MRNMKVDIGINEILIEANSFTFRYTIRISLRGHILTEEGWYEGDHFTEHKSVIRTILRDTLAYDLVVSKILPIMIQKLTNNLKINKP